MKVTRRLVLLSALISVPTAAFSRFCRIFQCSDECILSGGDHTYGGHTFGADCGDVGVADTRGRIFEDGFETGDVSRWGSNTGL